MRQARFLIVALIVAACGNDHSAALPDAGGDGWTQTRTFSFGPYTLQPGEEVLDDCVQITLGNDEDIYVNAVDLNTGVGFHHSNWFFDPESWAHGPHWDGSNSAVDDGTFKCADRNFDQSVAAIYGGVLTAQSTQVAHEVQKFPDGVVIKIPAHSKLMADIHLLNPGDAAIQVTPTIALTPLPVSQVTTKLSAVAFENHALGLPPMMPSRFTVDSCDLVGADQNPPAPWPAPNFKIYYALAHYHAMGTQMDIEAVKPDGTSATIFTTSAGIGDSLGGVLDPPFDMTGYTKLRFSCDYYNNTANTVVWGFGGEEMCVFLAFTDSPDNWGGGVPLDDAPGPGTDVNGVMTYTHACTSVFANPSN